MLAHSHCIVKLQEGQPGLCSVVAPVPIILSNDCRWSGALLGLSLCLAILISCEHVKDQCSYPLQNNKDFLLLQCIKRLSVQVSD